MNSLSVHKQVIPENPHGTSAELIPLADETQVDVHEASGLPLRDNQRRLRLDIRQTGVLPTVPLRPQRHRTIPRPVLSPSNRRGL